MIDLNSQRIAYIDARGKVVLKACPGSGKTTTIAYKLTLLVEKEFTVPNIGGIACLSFTNVAKDEIKQKYIEFSNKILSYPHIVTTIDSFINTYVTLPFYYLVSGRYERPQILDENTELDSLCVNYINELMYYNLTEKKRKFKHLNKENKPLLFIYKPSSIIKDLNGNYTFNGNLPDISKVDIAIFNDYAKTIKNWQLEKGILTNSDSTIVALNILSNYPQVSKSLANRFNFIIIDEAQDTSEIQHSIFDKLIENGLKNIELIGDPYQSLYVWRNAKPKVFINKYSDTNWQGLNLSDNWRSTQTIINTYSLLRHPTDENITAKKVFENEHPIYVLSFEKGKEFQALEKYEEICKNYKDNHAVTRGVDLSEKLNGISENTNCYWKNILVLKIIKCIADSNNYNQKSAIDSFRSVIIDFINPNINYKEKKDKLKELKNDYNLNSQLNALLIEFSDFNITLTEWTTKVAQRITEHFKLNKLLDFGLKKGCFSPHHKKLMKDLYSDRIRKWSFPISTIHKVKGMTLDTILLFLHKNGHSISIDDIVPWNGELTEYQTMIYVAMSRPKHILAIAIENSVILKKYLKNLVVN